MRSAPRGSYEDGDADVATGCSEELKLIVTHHHEDHSGNGGRLAEEFAGRLAVHAPVETVSYTRTHRCNVARTH